MPTENKPLENEYYGHRIVRHARNRQEVFKGKQSLGIYSTLGDAIQVAKGREPADGSRISEGAITEHANSPDAPDEE